MSKTKTITITVKKGRHAEQPYTYTIDQGLGPLLAPRERFTTRRNAKRSALRKLSAWKDGNWITYESVRSGIRMIGGKDCRITFIDI